MTDLQARPTRLLGWGVYALVVFCGVACSSRGPVPDVSELKPGVAADPETVVEAPEPLPLDFDGFECGARNAVPAEGRLLTRLQYDNTVTDLFYGLIEGPFTSAFPAENEVMGYRTNAEFHRVSPWLAEAHLAAAEHVATAVVAELDTLLPCVARQDQTDARQCAQEFLDTYGERAFRRPLSDQERQPLMQLFDTAFAQQGGAYGLELLTQALLQSPQFLYRLETNSVQGPGEEAVAVEDFELASRLSYLFWNTMPDDELFELAQSGQLRKPEVLKQQARRLIESPRSQTTLQDFASQWLGLSSLNSAVRQTGVTLSEDGSELPIESTEYSWSWRSSLQLYLAQIYEQSGTFQDLYQSTQVFVDHTLAKLYQVQIPTDLATGHFYAVAFDSQERAGLLTQPALMAMLAHPDQTAPILRGVFIREKLLCQPTPAPPPTVDQTPPRPDPGATTRERFAAHTGQSACAGCHELIDTLGLGLEGYDELGRYRSEENGLPLDLSGGVVATREEAIRGPFNGALELSARLANSSQARACYVTQWYRYGMGRVEQEPDLCSIRDIHEAFVASGGDLKEMLLSLATSDAFRYRAADVPSAEERP